VNRFLIEIGIEEMPSNVILPAVDQLKSLIKNTCDNYHLSFDLIKVFSTPRRLAVLVEGLPNKQEDRIIDLKGPPAEIAKDEGNKWTKSAYGFAKKNGIEINDLKFKEFDGKEYLFFQQKKLGRPVPELLQLHIEEWITQIHFPKNMKWGSYKMRFVRPIRWVVSLWNKVHISVKLEMLESGTKTQGHRFLSPGMTQINDAADYKKQLKKLNVMVDFEERRESIITQVKNLEREFRFDVELDNDLLEEVTNLVELPTVILGEFEEEFLELPDEVLVTSMAVNQRYFPVFRDNQNQKSGKKKLLPFFVTVRNGDKKNIDIVRRGNRKVLCARLNDAKFFYLDDQKIKLEEFCKRAKNVVFFQNRGSQLQRVQRIILLSQFIGEKLNLSQEQQKNIQRISELCKFDLETKMVQEFPKLQGFMGRNYASLKKETDIVCRGIMEHYYPRNTKDSFPKDSETVAVALADKLDLLITAFSINLNPSGAADPFALRRAAQGVIQLILGLRLSINIHELISKGLIILNKQLSLDLNIKKLKFELIEFLVKRQRWFFQEKGFRYDLIDAILGKLDDSFFKEKKGIGILPIEQLEFAELLSENLEKKFFKRSVESIVRAENICKKYPQKIAKTFNESHLFLAEEIKFFKILEPIINSEKDFCWSPLNFLKLLLSIEPVVTSFFENVLVMDEDPLKCGNRLWLCRELSNWSKRHLDLKSIVFS